MARLSKLEGGRVIAQIGAVLGREFSFDLIKEVAPLDDGTLKDVLDRLVNSGLLYKRGFLSKSNYIFKHALIQDALYESLLKKERKRYHKKVASVLAEKFPNIIHSQPELLAHHYKEGEEYENAVTYWIVACEKAAKESANAEVISLAGNALNALVKLPECSARNNMERKILLLQGPALLAVKGWSSPEIGNAYKRAKELYKKEEDVEQDLFLINRGLWGYFMVSAQLADSVRISNELMVLAEQEDSDEMRLEAHATYCDSYFWLGNPSLALEHAEKGLALYNLDAHHLLHSLKYGEDPSVVMLCYSLLSLWLLGYEDKAEERGAYIKDHLNKYNHKFSKGFLYNALAWYHMLKEEPEEAIKWGVLLKDLSLQQDFTQWLAVATIQVGWAKAITDNSAAGIKEMLEGLELWTSTGGVVSLGFSIAMLVDACMKTERFSEALVYVNKGLHFFSTNEQKYYQSEIFRQKAEILSMTVPYNDEVEELYGQSLLLARTQKAVALEQKALNSWKKFTKVKVL
jgi:tetratricopeptide (TPR) repeat protein